MEELHNPELQQAQVELRDLLRRCKAGDCTAQPKLGEFLDRRSEVWKRLGDLGYHLQEAILNTAAGTDLGVRELIRRSLEATKSELAGASPSPVRRLLAERVALAAAFVYLVDLEAVQAGKATGKRATLMRKRQESANKMYLESLRLLHSFDRVSRRAAPQPKAPQAEMPGVSSTSSEGQVCENPAGLRLVG